MPSKALTVSLAASGATVQPAFPPVPPRRRQASVTSSESTSTSCNLPPNLPANRLYPALPTQPMMFNNGVSVSNIDTYDVRNMIQLLLGVIYN